MYYIVKSAEEDYLAGKDTRDFHMTKDRERATGFKSTEKALNVINNLPKILRSKSLKIVLIDNKEGKRKIKSEIKRESEIEILGKQLSEYDKALTDIDHFLEFNFKRISASEGYMLMKMRQDFLMERREIKNKLIKLKDPCKKMGEYRPRVLKTLFTAKDNNQLIYYK
jgi:hypothetical protein